MVWQHNFCKHHAFFLCEIVNNPIIVILDTFPRTISGGGNRTLSASSACDVDIE